MKKLFKFIVLALVLLVIYIGYNFATFNSKQVAYDAIEKITISESSVEHLSQAIQIKTVSHEHAEDFDSTAFLDFNNFIDTTFAYVDSLLEKKTFNDFGLLYKWQGSDVSLKPIALMGHYDVVPVMDIDTPKWLQSPFGGDIVDGMLWGRGAIDDKMAVIGLLETAEMLLKKGWQPKRTIYFVFGHDEEVGGTLGAKTIASYFRKEQIELEYVLDEGMSIIQKLIPGIDKNAALIGIAEKGFVSVYLSTEIEGGHSSMPNDETAIDVLANAIARMKANPFPARISEPVDLFMDYIGPEMPLDKRIGIANRGIFKSFILGQYQKRGSSAAIVRTTTAPTIFHGGLKENIIPTSASATINFRILTGESIAEVEQFVINTINDERVKIKLGAFSSEPSKVSSINCIGYNGIRKTVVELFPDALTAPSLLVGATDSRHFRDVSDNIYKFSPIYIGPHNIKSFHGLNERIPVSEFKNVIRFYVRLLENTAM